MTITVFATDPDQIRRVLCDRCCRAYVTHPSCATDHQLRGFAVDHGWTIGVLTDLCPICSKATTTT